MLLKQLRRKYHRSPCHASSPSPSAFPSLPLADPLGAALPPLSRSQVTATGRGRVTCCLPTTGATTCTPGGDNTWWCAWERPPPLLYLLPSSTTTTTTTVTPTLP
ncbi:hypothetical protein E2C01_035792 [Portunus trituberculatus]|uniref:Uncharacterized protein n=1 Tax=Portunus trituberculatus TaxID=210409 RepID=A0A5B7FAP1_PORTR|nr:hypothetical protein [Portunus trituberculatus]